MSLSYQEISGLCEALEGAICKDIGADDPLQVRAKLDLVSTLIGNLPLMMSCSESMYASVLKNARKSCSNATDAKLESQTSMEYALMRRCEVLSKQIHYAIEALRSLYSTAKQDRDRDAIDKAPSSAYEHLSRSKRK